MPGWSVTQPTRPSVRASVRSRSSLTVQAITSMPAAPHFSTMARFTCRRSTLTRVEPTFWARPTKVSRCALGPATSTVRACGSRLWISISATSWNDSTETRSSRSRSVSTLASDRAAATSLISAWIGSVGPTASSTSPNVGMRSPRPASSFLSFRSFWSAIGPEPFVVRSRVSSCMTTSSPSLLRCRSSSMPSSPSRSARRKERRVFSGSAAMTPRWPMVKKDTRLPSLGVVVRGSRTSAVPPPGGGRPPVGRPSLMGPSGRALRAAWTAPERAPGHRAS